jgi:hypothetical protein
MYQLLFQGAPEAFHWSIIKAVPRALIDDLHWLMNGLANLGVNSVYPDRVIKFVMECQLPNGGFSRSTIMGIPTLEYTFYAMSILKQADAI